jgi:hypothetical protein
LAAAPLYPKVDRSVVSLLAKPVEVGAASQRLIPTGKRSGLLTRIATTEKRFVVRAGEKLTAFLELEAAIWTHSLGRTYE